MAFLISAQTETLATPAQKLADGNSRPPDAAGSGQEERSAATDSERRRVLRVRESGSLVIGRVLVDREAGRCEVVDGFDDAPCR